MTGFSKSKNLRVLSLDVDGVLTDGKLYYADSGEAMKAFHSSDGVAILEFIRQGWLVVMLSASHSEGIISARARDLEGVSVIAGASNKKTSLLNFIETRGYSLDEVCHVGDDLQDINLLESVGCPACPSDAHPKVIATSRLVLRTPGGAGCVRELAMRLLPDLGTTESSSVSS